MKHVRRGKVVKETTAVAYAATSLSAREAAAGKLDALIRRHWMAETRHHYVRDNYWREDRTTWRTGRTAYVMFLLLATALNLLRCASHLWTGKTSMPKRSIAADYAATVAPQRMLNGLL